MHVHVQLPHTYSVLYEEYIICACATTTVFLHAGVDIHVHVQLSQSYSVMYAGVDTCTCATTTVLQCNVCRSRYMYMCIYHSPTVFCMKSRYMYMCNYHSVSVCRSRYTCTCTYATTTVLQCSVWRVDICTCATTTVFLYTGVDIHVHVQLPQSYSVMYAGVDTCTHGTDVHYTKETERKWA